jgi:hypothetical protein
MTNVSKIMLFKLNLRRKTILQFDITTDIATRKFLIILILMYLIKTRV